MLNRYLTPFYAVRVAFALAGAAAAVSARGESTGSDAAEIVLAALFGMAVTYGCSRSRRWAWIPAATLATALAGDVVDGVAGASALVIAGGAAVFFDRRAREVGAVVGVLLARALLGLATVGPTGTPTLLVVACLVPIAASAWPFTPEAVRRRARRLLVAAVVLGAVATASAVASALAARQDLRLAIDSADRGMAAARAGDAAQASGQLMRAANSFRAAHGRAGGARSLPGRFLPIVGDQLQAVSDTSAAGAELAVAASTALDDADVNQLTLTNGRLDPQLVKSFATPLAGIERRLERARTTARHARSPWLVSPIAERVAVFEDLLEDAQRETAVAADAVGVLPDLLGDATQRRYLLLLLNPAEGRDHGGIVGAYGTMLVDDGRLSLEFTEAASTLTEQLERIGASLDPTAGYPAQLVAQRPQRFAQNWAGSPDLDTVATLVADLWPQVSDAPIDGVLAVDPVGLAAFVQLLGPIDVPGVGTLDGPRTEDLLLRRQYSDFPERAARKDLLADVADVVFDDLTAGRLASPRQLIEVLGPVVAGRHLQLRSLHPEPAEFLEAAALDAQFGPTGGDVLLVTQENGRANKLDPYLQRSVRYEPSFDPATSAVDAELTIKLENVAPGPQLPATVTGGGGPWPATTYVGNVNIYSPFNLVRATLDGASLPTGTTPASGLQRHSIRVEVPEGASRLLIVHLRGQVSTGRYQLTFLPSLTARPDLVTIQVAVPGRTAVVAGPDLPVSRTIRYRSDRALRGGAPTQP